VHIGVEESCGVDTVQPTYVLQNGLPPATPVDNHDYDASFVKPKQPPRSSRRSLLARGPAVKEFEVNMEKGSSMGIDVAKCKDGNAILVARIKEGAVQDWNHAEAAADRTDSVIRRGDRIVSVNGSGLGSSGEVMAALKSASGIVTMKIVRLVEFKVGNLPNLPRDLLGLEYEENEFGELKLTKVGPEANKKLQQDVELRPGDLIVKVNGSAEMLRAEIMLHNTLELRIRRPDSPFVYDC